MEEYSTNKQKHDKNKNNKNTTIESNQELDSEFVFLLLFCRLGISCIQLHRRYFDLVGSLRNSKKNQPVDQTNNIQFVPSFNTFSNLPAIFPSI